MDFEFLDYEERFFWKKIFDSSIRSGDSAYQAQLQADASVLYLRSRKVVRKA